MELLAGQCGGEKNEENEDNKTAPGDDRKFSTNPLGPPTLSSNPLGEIAAPPRKRSTVTGTQ